MKQALIEGADRLPNTRAAEQGAGKINLTKSAAILRNYLPRASAFPAALNLTDCPYLWPHCEQPLFSRGAPLMLNVTLLNGMGPTGRVVGEPTFTLSKKSSGDSEGKQIPSPLLEVRFEHSRRLYPWSGFLAVYVHVADSPAARAFDGVVQGQIEVVIASPRAMVGDGDRRAAAGKKSSFEDDIEDEEDEVTSTVVIPLIARVVPTPPRSKRVLWDQRHSVRYPPSYLPRDSLSVKHDVLDWHGEKRKRGKRFLKLFSFSFSGFFSFFRFQKKNSLSFSSPSSPLPSTQATTSTPTTTRSLPSCARRGTSSTSSAPPSTASARRTTVSEVEKLEKKPFKKKLLKPYHSPFPLFSLSSLQNPHNNNH